MPGIRGSILSILSRMLACQEFQWNSCLSFLTLTLCKKIGFWPSCWPIFLGVAADGYVHSNFYSSLEFILWWPKSYNSISFLTWHYYFWNKIEVLQKKNKKKKKKKKIDFEPFYVFQIRSTQRRWHVWVSS